MCMFILIPQWGDFVDLTPLVIIMNQAMQVIISVNLNILKLHARFCGLHSLHFSGKRNLTLQTVNNIPAVDI